MTMLHVDRVSKSFASVHAVQEVTFRVDAGEIYGLLGPNGAGKTTLLKTISGLNVPVSGEIQFMGESIVGVAPYLITQKGIAHVPEGRSLFPNMSVGENLNLGGNLLPQHERAGTLEWVLQLFPKLRERFKQLAGSLSGGEQQMVALGRALMLKPRHSTTGFSRM